MLTIAALWGIVLSERLEVSLAESAAAPHTAHSIQCRLDDKGMFAAGELAGGKFTPHVQTLSQLRKRERELLTTGRIITARRTRAEREALTFRRAVEDAYCNSNPQSSVQTTSQKFSVSSRDFIDRGSMPAASSCWQNGFQDTSSGRSPAISWQNAPQSATQLALVVSDAKTSLIHWLIILDKRSSYYISGLPRGFPLSDSSSEGGVSQRKNYLGIRGYSGVCPTPGERRRFIFELYALRKAKIGTMEIDVETVRKSLIKFQVARASYQGYFTGIVSPTPETAIETPSHTSSPTNIPTSTPTDTNTPNPTATPTSTFTDAPTATSTPTDTPANTPTVTPTVTPTFTSTSTRTPTRTPTPTPVPLENGVSITTGQNHTCALISGGTVKCWGQNLYGSLGNTADESSVVPINISNLSDVTQVSAGFFFTCALQSTGTIKCWGRGEEGQLGYGGGSFSKFPETVLGITDATQVATGYYHACARLSTGGVKCWGLNNRGQLGDNSQTTKSSPVAVSGLSSGVVHIAAGGEHTCAVLDTGGVKCWGRNYDGQIGNNAWADVSVPTDVDGLSSGASKVALGETVSCALLSSGAAKCWGAATYGQRGDGNSWGASNVPTNVYNLTTATDISAFGGHVCVIISGGGMQCWGYNGTGQLGINSIASWAFPQNVTGLSSGVTNIAGGGFHTCALLDTQTFKCWGRNLGGQVGNPLNYPSVTSVNTPVPVLRGW